MALKIVFITCMFTWLPSARADAPRPRTNQTDDGHPVLTNAGLDIPLLAKPVPQTFQYYYVGNSTVSAGAKPVPDRMFDTGCRSHGSAETELVVCTVKPAFGARFKIGGYLLGISNVHGGYLFEFKINHEVLPPITEDRSSVKRGELIALVLVASCLLLVVAVICLLVIRNKRQ